MRPLIDGQEKQLRAWDFVHCPPGTAHCFLGAGTGPCVIFMTGACSEDREIVYPDSELARAYGTGVEAETKSPAEAYALRPHWESRRPKAQGLPWVDA
jgi:uncharacterized cupin superfamily protein